MNKLTLLSVIVMGLFTTACNNDKSKRPPSATDDSVTTQPVSPPVENTAPDTPSTPDGSDPDDREPPIVVVPPQDTSPEDPVPETPEAMLFLVTTQAGSGGLITPSSIEVEKGQQGRFSIHPGLGYQIGSVSGCGGAFTTEHSAATFVTAPVTSACTITATFNPIPVEKLAIESESSRGGQLRPATMSIPKGGDAVFTVVADEGYVLDEISGCDGALHGFTYRINNLQSSCLIDAKFISNVANAVRNQDASLASESELIAAAQEVLVGAEAKRKALLSSLYDGIDTINWTPSHDAVRFNIDLPDQALVVLPSNVNGSGAPFVRGLIVAGEDSKQRYVAMASSTFSVSRNPQIDLLTQRLLAWLRGEQRNSKMHVVTAQLPSQDSYWFPYNERIRVWFDEFYKDRYTMNRAGECDYANLLMCITQEKPDLVILGSLDKNSIGYDGIRTAIEKMRSEGIPLLLVNHLRSVPPMLQPLHDHLGLNAGNNYWDKAEAKNLLVNDLVAEQPQHRDLTLLFDNLKHENFDTEWLSGCTVNYLNCNADEFSAQFKAGADILSRTLTVMDQKGIHPFVKRELSLLSIAVLLADKYRAGIDYPIEWHERAAWQKALFADWVISYAWPKNNAQSDLGQYVTDRANVFKGSNSHYQYPEKIVRERKIISVPSSGNWTTTGWYALPGQMVTMTRHDESSANVEIKLNYHRSNTNRVFQNKVYRSPLALQSQRLKLAKSSSVQFSTPYGGPIYIHISNSDPTALSVDLTVSGAVKHPTIMDFSDEAQIQNFEELLATTEIPHVDLRTDGAEQHLRRDRFTKAIGTNIKDVKALLTSIVEDHINNLYTLAGYKIVGKTLNESLPPSVLAICQHFFNDDCVDEALHTRRSIQHANYDQDADCGGWCSGNPWDSSTPISPTGWGDNHEVGHNLQNRYLNVNYVEPENRNNWAQYSSRASENSNNIFPYYVLWKTHHIRDGNTSTIKDSHMNHKDLFYVFMSDAANLTDSSGKRVVYNRLCRVMDSGEDRYTVPWKRNDYAIHNGYRMSFYIQMALKAHRLEFASGDSLDNGFNIFTLLYQHARIFDKYSKDEVLWSANKERLGFELFDYTSNVLYGGKTIRDIPGNDFMLISLSKLTQYDWRSHFDMLGLRYSDLAVQQTLRHIKKGDMPMGMYVLDTELPPYNMSHGLDFLPLSLGNSSTLWRGLDSPTQCSN